MLGGWEIDQSLIYGFRKKLKSEEISKEMIFLKPNALLSK